MTKNINIASEKRDLKDYIRLVIAFFFCLVLLSFYQNMRLYFEGVLDSIINKSFFLLVLHHTGFTSLTALILAFLFNFLEYKKPALGFKTVAVVFLLIVISEGILIEYYIHNYEILGTGFYERYVTNVTVQSFILSTLIFMILGIGLMYLFYRFTASYYKVISRMYPFTIVLFSLFLATLVSQKNPVNENKTQHLLQSVSKDILDFNKYEGAEEYPLLQPYKTQRDLTEYFLLKEEKPNIVFIVMDGVGADFVGDKAPYNVFMPNLNSLTSNSLYWPNFVSNTGEAVASIPALFGSLPFGNSGFTNLEDKTKRTTLFGILKDNGYNSSFNFGGNSALESLDKFLYEEEVDVVLDRKGFNITYRPQEQDAAGISLGYADKDLFHKWQKDFESTYRPRIDVFLTQSTKNPFKIPEQKKYISQVQKMLSNSQVDPQHYRLINKNREVFASLLYADEAISSFLEDYKRKAEFQNTIFIITGSHNLSELPQHDYLSRYRVPLIIYSPLLKESKTINSLVAHTDVLPSIAGLLKDVYDIEVPNQVSWLGEGLVHEGIFKSDKRIPLYRHKENLQEYIKDKYCLSGNRIYALSYDLKFMNTDLDNENLNIKEEYRRFKAINNYVTTQNKIIPDDTVLSTELEKGQSKSDIVWINSVFNGRDFDNAYKIARDLAFDGETERSLLLCKYILEKVPGHADTEILMGRIYAWNKEYNKAANILETAIKKYPVYADGYAALLDVYFWSDTNYKVESLKERIKKNSIRSNDVINKIKRAEAKMKKEKTLFESNNLGYLNFEDNDY